MRWLGRLKNLLRPTLPEHLRRGALGETAAKSHLKQAGLKFLTANFKDRHGEIDLIFRDGEELVFVEVKTRSSEEWTRPADAVDRDKQRRLVRTSETYLAKLGHPDIPWRYDIVEVLLSDGRLHEIRHLPNEFGPPD